MSLVTRSSEASVDPVSALYAPQIAALVAGEDLDAVAPCYIKNSDGKVYMSNGTAANEAAKCHGYTQRPVGAGRPLTLYGIGTRFHYGSSLSIGATLYIGATAGRLDDAATTGDTVGVATVVSTTDIVITRANGKQE